MSVAGQHRCEHTDFAEAVVDAVGRGLSGFGLGGEVGDGDHVDDVVGVLAEEDADECMGFNVAESLLGGDVGDDAFDDGGDDLLVHFQFPLGFWLGFGFVWCFVAGCWGFVNWGGKGCSLAPFVVWFRRCRGAVRESAWVRSCCP